MVACLKILRLKLCSVSRPFKLIFYLKTLSASRLYGVHEYGSVDEKRIGSTSGNARRKLSPMPLCPPQIPHYFTYGRTWAAGVRTGWTIWHSRQVSLTHVNYVPVFIPPHDFINWMFGQGYTLDVALSMLILSLSSIRYSHRRFMKHWWRFQLRTSGFYSIHHVLYVPITSLSILSRDKVTVDGVLIGNWIYWTLIDRNYT
jgi:hypothetical protein